MGNRLSDSKINLIAFDVRDGTASQEDARLLLMEFVESVQDDRSELRVSRILLEHFRDCFASYLNGERGIEAALGLARRRSGRPRADDRRHQDIAADVLRERMYGRSLEEAADLVSERYHLRETQVRQAWGRWKQTAFVILLQERVARGPGSWDPEEKARLSKIFRNEKWWASDNSRLSKIFKKRGKRRLDKGRKTVQKNRATSE